MTIDVWAQHPNQQFMRAPWLATLWRWIGAEPPTELPLEATVAAMDAGGVSIALLSGWHGPTGVLISNDEVAKAVAAYPGRFAGVAGVDLSDPMGAVREIRRCVTELGFVAVRVVPWLWNLPPNDRRYYPIYVACVELGVPFCTHIGHTGPLMPSEPGRPIPYLDEVRGRGRTRVLFGTNWPMLAADRALSKLDKLGLDDEAKDLYLSGNARRVFSLPAP